MLSSVLGQSNFVGTQLFLKERGKRVGGMSDLRGEQLCCVDDQLRRDTIEAIERTAWT
jgi:hypothetical protein